MRCKATETLSNGTCDFLLSASEESYPAHIGCVLFTVLPLVLCLDNTFTKNYSKYFYVFRAWGAADYTTI